jgi:hypothetical protein
VFAALTTRAGTTRLATTSLEVLPSRSLASKSFVASIRTCPFHIAQNPEFLDLVPEQDQAPFDLADDYHAEGRGFESALSRARSASGFFAWSVR